MRLLSALTLARTEVGGDTTPSCFFSEMAAERSADHDAILYGLCCNWHPFAQRLVKI